MDRLLVRLSRLLPGLWLGGLICVAGLATPAPFALLAQAEAGRVVGRILAQEAYLSLVLGVVILLLERRASAHAAEAGWGSQFGMGMVPVSYTHLDVYKRQPLNTFFYILRCLREL